MKSDQQWVRPDTSKNGRLKKNELNVTTDIKERGRSVLSRLGKNTKESNSRETER